MTLTSAHGYVLGVAIIGGWAVVGLWALILRLVGRDESALFWRVVSIAQIVLVANLVLGAILLLMGRRPGPGGWFNTTFHFLYGFGFPLIVLFFAHKWAREGRWHPFLLFSVASLVIVGLTLRGFMVGIFGT